ncbi:MULTISPECIES: hypothetical protein [Asticcacaulis]|uniref:hypothetical protein n=1 Tax=Asticcacaulis TaxID=76890 RepID=UPI001AE1C0EA|nr:MULTISPECIES: hypothetical protein [Asticcacaulis]MBP2161895.1 hypothetical protein [Asticcacaulis solisilvae]MDR6802943.1 hypothetical protein [Asticcacaulis sp. BE141]
MRISVIAAAMLLASATAAIAEPAEIPFRNVFATLAEKTTRASDRAFFETEVLRGQAMAEPDRFSDRAGATKYTYGPQMRQGIAYLNSTGAKNTVSFSAESGLADRGADCLTFAEADGELLRHGWSYTRPKTTTSPGEMVGAVYQRAGVALSLSNTAIMMSFESMASSPEARKAARDRLEALRQERLNTTRGTEAYAKLCPDMIDVAFVRQD